MKIIDLPLSYINRTNIDRTKVRKNTKQLTYAIHFKPSDLQFDELTIRTILRWLYYTQIWKILSCMLKIRIHYHLSYSRSYHLSFRIPYFFTLLFEQFFPMNYMENYRRLINSVLINIIVTCNRACFWKSKPVLLSLHRIFSLLHFLCLEIVGFELRMLLISDLDTD